uniref:Uncharacterized protein n=1 Tax=Craspedostauros australis TaxID=1486917 RepID=A0A7R9WY97_9STRA|mmetsp:Transcript_4669/g.12176  ORF Transcript_4669/g.12176 Transcript_4669/m.12176 type:complete len:345 (+) Transcript_4669:149-1183(+)
MAERATIEDNRGGHPPMVPASICCDHALQAALEGDLKTVQTFVDQERAKVSANDFKAAFASTQYISGTIRGKSTLIHNACIGGHLSIVEYLVSTCGANVNSTTKYGTVPLHGACAQGHLEVVKYLVTSCGADVNVRNQVNLRPLNLACRYGHMSVVHCLCDSGRIDVSIFGPNQPNPLHWACCKGHLNIARYLVDRFDINVDVRDSTSHTALLFACLSDNFHLVKYLVEQCGANPNLADLRFENSSLHTACSRGHERIVAFLLSLDNLETVSRNTVDDTPFHDACEGQHLDVVERWLASGRAWGDERDGSDSSLLEIAARHGDEELMETFLRFLPQGRTSNLIR